MEKLVKIAEITVETVESAKKIAEALVNAGFQVAYDECENLSRYMYVIEKRQ